MSREMKRRNQRYFVALILWSFSWKTSFGTDAEPDSSSLQQHSLRLSPLLMFSFLFILVALGLGHFESKGPYESHFYAKIGGEFEL